LATAITVAALNIESVSNAPGDDVSAITNPTGVGNNTSTNQGNNVNKGHQEKNANRVALENISQVYYMKK
jgi:hypothetical protein